jgi:hypothetical protein
MIIDIPTIHMDSGAVNVLREGRRRTKRQWESKSQNSKGKLVQDTKMSNMGDQGPTSKNAIHHTYAPTMRETSKCTTT